MTPSDRICAPPMRQTMTMVLAQPCTPCPRMAVTMAQMAPMRPRAHTSAPSMVMMRMGFTDRLVIPFIASVSILESG